MKIKDQNVKLLHANTKNVRKELDLGFRANISELTQTRLKNIANILTKNNIASIFTKSEKEAFVRDRGVWGFWRCHMDLRSIDDGSPALEAIARSGTGALG
jgi:hypothetical protein